MTRIILFSFLCLLTHHKLSSQGENSNWHFGCGAGITFTANNTVEHIPSNIGVREGTVSVSDESGQLLFYSDGINIYDSGGDVTVTGLLGSGSSTTSIVAAPVTGTPDEYWLFTTTNLDEEGGLNQYRYNVALRTLTEGPVLLVDNQTEKMALSYRCSEEGFWLVTQDRFGSFLIFSVTETVSLHETIAASPSPLSRRQTVGYLKFSEDGRFLATALPEVVNNNRGGQVIIYNFSQATGRIENPSTPLVLPFGDEEQGNYIGNPYGLQFSPSGRFLYVSLSANVNFLQEGGELYQFDLEATSPNDSRTLIGKANQATLVYGSLQLGPNGKIYLAMEGDSDPTYACGCFGTYPFLGVINNPEALGTDSNFDQNGLELANGSSGDDCGLVDHRGSKLGLPNFISGLYNNPRLEVPETRTICRSDSIRLLPGSPQTGFSYLITGPDFLSENFFVNVSPDTGTTYSIVATSAACGEVTEEIRIEVIPEVVVNITGDTTICLGDDLRLIASTPGGDVEAVYTWALPDGSTFIGQELTLEEAPLGTYQVHLMIDGVCREASAMVVVSEDTSRLLPPFTISAVTEDGQELLPGSQVMGGTVVILTVNGLPSDQNFTYSWTGNFTPSTGNGLSLSVTIPATSELAGENLEYTLEVGSEDGSSCLAEESIVLLRLPGLYRIPALITPNGDGINDVFRLFHNGVVQNFRLTIFNRWGQKVFITSDPNDAWDGTIDGEPQNRDLFLYLMAFTFDGIERKEEGQFTLIR